MTKKEEIEIVFDDKYPSIKLKTPLEIAIEENEKELNDYRKLKHLIYYLDGFVIGALFSFVVCVIVVILFL